MSGVAPRTANNNDTRYYTVQFFGCTAVSFFPFSALASSVRRLMDDRVESEARD